MKFRRSIPGLVSFFQSFFHSNIAGGILLLLSTIFAILAANIPALSGFHNFWNIEAGFHAGDLSVSMSLRNWVNDGLMAVFFFLVGLEIKRELLVGELSSPKKAMLPMFAALGGMIFPALIYTLFNWGTPTQNGWGIPMATDIAFAIGVLSLLGKSCPIGLKVFLTALAIVDDIGSIIVLAIFYPTNELQLMYLLYAAVVVLILVLFNRLRIKHVIAYLVPGLFLFIFFFKSGIHATIAGVILAMTIPAKSSINEVRYYVSTKRLLEKFKKAGNGEVQVLANNEQLDLINRLARNSNSINPLVHKLEEELHPWVHFLIMPIFALANAGVAIDGSVFSNSPLPPVMKGIFFGLFLGKPIGIFLFSWLAVKLKLAQLPKNTTWIQILLLGIVGGIGFTMSIFIDNLAFTNQAFIDEGKLAILVTSCVSAIVGVIALKLLYKFTKNKEVINQ